MATVDPALSSAYAQLRLIIEGLVYAARQCGDTPGEDALLYAWDELRALVKADGVTMPARIA